MPTRRLALAAGLAGLAAPYVWSRGARAAGQIVVRTPGGAYEESQRRNVYAPFTKATGIEVVPVPATIAKLLAMFKSGNVELDVIDAGYDALMTLNRASALAPIAYDKWRHANVADLPAELKTPTMIGYYTYATVLGYHREGFAGGQHPASWAEFWDTAKFPGPRMLADMASGQPNLEFALIADGVPFDKLYPIDLDRAFASLGRIRPQIKKFWDTGALSAQMLADKEVVAGSIWNGRIQAVIDKGAPLAIEWNQNMLQVQGLAVFKDAKNFEGAQLLIDYSFQPEAQLGFARELNYGPVNRKSYDLLPPELANRLPGGPKLKEKGFLQNVEWWDENRAKVNDRWSKWILG
jgi:putative spermidine/putrescine transport system substrate-binding protein